MLLGALLLTAAIICVILKTKSLKFPDLVLNQPKISTHKHTCQLVVVVKSPVKSPSKCVWFTDDWGWLGGNGTRIAEMVCHRTCRQAAQLKCTTEDDSHCSVWQKRAQHVRSSCSHTRLLWPMLIQGRDSVLPFPNSRWALPQCLCTWKGCSRKHPSPRSVQRAGCLCAHHIRVPLAQPRGPRGAVKSPPESYEKNS